MSPPADGPSEFAEAFERGLSEGIRSVLGSTYGGGSAEDGRDGGGAAGTPAAAAPLAAGVALVAADTGRVLMIQRALIDGEPAGGLWEMPGGKLDEGEAPWEGAAREFAEEVGHPLPEGETVGTWLSPNGVYRGFVHLAPEEDARLTDGSRSTHDPDNPGQTNYTECCAWFDPAHLRNGPKLLRAEVRAGTPWRMIADAPGRGREEALVAGAETAYLTLDAEDEDLLEELLAAAPSGGRPPNSVKLSTGWAFPIPNVAFLRRAVRAFGRAKPEDRDRVKAHIRSRARELGATDLLPDAWTASADGPDWLVAAMSAPSSAFLPAEPLPGPTPFTVAEDLTADGHLCLWASCHVGFQNACVRPPKEEDFPAFNLGDAVTADGRHVAVGRVTLGTGHAGPDLTWRTAAAHYDDTGTQVAVVRASADRWGIRLSGQVVPGATEERVDELRRSPLSGDWRRVDGRLRLVAALAVNSPGYPVPRSLVASGEVQSLTWSEDWAAGQAHALAASLGLDWAARAAALRAEVEGAA